MNKLFRLFLALTILVSGLFFSTSPAHAEEEPIFSLLLLNSEQLTINSKIQTEITFSSPFGGQYHQGEWMLSWPPELVSTSLPGSSYGSVFSGNSSAFSQRFSFHATRAGVYNLHLEWACQNGTEFYDGFVDLPVVVMGIEYLGVFDYQFTPSTMGPGLEVISFNGGSVIEVSFDGQSFEWSKELHAGSNFFQTTGWRRFRFVAKEGYVIYTPVQNESNKWIGEGLEFVPTPVYTIFLPLVQN